MSGVLTTALQSTAVGARTPPALMIVRRMGGKNDGRHFLQCCAIGQVNLEAVQGRRGQRLVFHIIRHAVGVRAEQTEEGEGGGGGGGGRGGGGRGLRGRRRGISAARPRAEGRAADR